MSSSAELHLTTSRAREILDLTDRVAALVTRLPDGVVVVSAPHTTVALFVSELDQELMDDYMKVADGLFAVARPFAHRRNNNPNAEAHMMSAMLGTSVTVSVEGGKLRLGAYQRIAFFELDGPKERTVRVAHLASS